MKIIKFLKSIIKKIEIFYFEISRNKINKIMSELTNDNLDVKNLKKGGILIEGLWDHPHHWLRLVIFLKAAKQIFGRKITGVYEFGVRKKILQSLKSLKLDYEIIVPNKIPKKYYQKSKKILSNFDSIADLLNFKLNNGYPLFMFYDGVLKKEFLGEIELHHPSLEKELAKTLFLLNFYNEKISKININAIVVSHPTTIRFSTLLWVGLKKNIPVYILNYRNNFITIRYLKNEMDFHKISNDICDHSDLLKISDEKKSNLISRGKKFINKINDDANKEISMFRNEPNFNLKNKNDFLSYFKAKNKPTILVLSSCFPDFPNANGVSYLENHVSWIKSTLEFAKKTNEFNWIFKTHPAEHLYGDKITLRKLIKNYLNENIFITSNELNYHELIQYTDCVITSVGSAGYELTAMGKRVIMARNSSMSSWNFVKYAKNMNEYFDLLKKAPYINLPNEDNIIKANIYACLLGTTPENFANGYKFPFGRYGYKLWKDLDKFILINKNNFLTEAKFIEKWIESKKFSYNSYKNLN